VRVNAGGIVAKLTKKQETFCREYIIDLNMTQAAIRAGYSEKTAQRIGSENFSKPLIQSRISELMDARNSANDINANYVLKRLVEIDQMDVADILNDNGDIKPVKEWPKVWRTSLSAIDVQLISSGDMDVITKKVKWPDKLRNLELLGKHVSINAFTAVNDDNHKDKIIQRVVVEVVSASQDISN
jgi:phage terminase small subunit